MTRLFNFNHKAVSPAPQRLIIAVMAVLCLGILASSLFTFVTLDRLRGEYLSNRAHELVSSIEIQARGPGRRNNPAFWQSILESNLEAHSGSVASLALLDGMDRVLASAGPQAEDRGVFYLEEPLPRPRNPRGEANPATAGWRIRLGLYSANADFIRRVACLQLIVSGLGVAALIVLSIYLMRMLKRFVELKAREAAEAQLRSLGIMAASLSHEIRNPLGAMKGLTQLAQEDLPADHAAQAHLHTVVREAERLEGLVTDLLNFARPRKPQIGECNLPEMLAEIRTMLQSRLDAAKAALRITLNPSPFHFRSDPAGVRQVLMNVLINAIDATPPDGIIEITAEHRHNPESVVIRVDDQGVGLGRKDPEELFQPFITTKTRGTGLGLTISRQIVESLGGSISLENRPEGGARCSINLPAL